MAQISLETWTCYSVIVSYYVYLVATLPYMDFKIYNNFTTKQTKQRIMIEN